jgi:hypothetical protein
MFGLALGGVVAECFCYESMGSLMGDDDGMSSVLSTVFTVR